MTDKLEKNGFIFTIDHNLTREEQVKIISYAMRTYHSKRDDIKELLRKYSIKGRTKVYEAFSELRGSCGYIWTDKINYFHTLNKAVEILIDKAGFEYLFVSLCTLENYHDLGLSGIINGWLACCNIVGYIKLSATSTINWEFPVKNENPETNQSTEDNLEDL